MSVDTKALEKEIETLGILNIEASGNLTPECVNDAVNAVKSVKLDFADLAAQIRKNKANPTR